MSQLRLNPLTGRWVTVATSRELRPDDFRRERLAVETGPVRPCPLCPGNEEATPPALETFGPEGDWALRVVPNRFPAFQGNEPMTVRNLGPVFDQAPASGVHEVFVFSRQHESGWADLDDQQAEMVMTALQHRFDDHRKMPVVRYTQAVVNHGREAGASLVHPHGQIMGMPFVPRDLTEEEAGFNRFAGGCVLCTTAEAERDAAVRVVLDRDGVLVVCPFWAGSPYEMLVIPDHHEGHFAQAKAPTLDAVGKALRDVQVQLRDRVSDPAYNLVLHTLPHHHTDDFHWHIHIVPRIQSQGGFEQGTGVPINIVAPEQATSILVDPGTGPARPAPLRAQPAGSAYAAAMGRIRVSTVIDAPPDRVWEVVRHLDRHIDWMADAEAIRFTSASREGRGTTFDCDTRIGPFKLTDRMEVTTWQTAKAIGVRHVGLVTGTGEFRLRSVLRARHTRTRFTWDEELVFPWWMGGRVGAAAARPLFKALWRRNLHALKRIVEATGQAAGPIVVGTSVVGEPVVAAPHADRWCTGLASPTAGRGLPGGTGGLGVRVGLSANGGAAPGQTDQPGDQADDAEGLRRLDRAGAGRWPGDRPRRCSRARTSWPASASRSPLTGRGQRDGGRGVVRLGLARHDGLDPAHDGAVGVGLDGREHQGRDVVGQGADPREPLELVLADLPPVQVISETTWLTGPSSVWIGLAKVMLVTWEVQPGTGSTATPVIGVAVGNFTSSSMVDELSISFGTRNTNVCSAPSTAVDGSTTTWAKAGVARPTTRTAASRHDSRSRALASWIGFFGGRSSRRGGR